MSLLVDRKHSWHKLQVNKVLQVLNADPVNGLSEAAIAQRRAVHGSNRLIEQPPKSHWLRLLDQFKGFLIVVLIGAAVLAGAIGNIKDAAAILIVIIINALLGFYQEYRAERSLESLKKMLAPEAEVRRAGQTRMIPADELVPGDIVLLDAGDRVPADGRVIIAHNFEVDESSLTGESHPVGKRNNVSDGEAIPLAERDNMVYMNTIVTRGRAEMVITETGMDTEMGQLAGMLSDTSETATPLQLQLDVLGKRLAGIAGIVVFIMLVSGLLRGEPWVQMVMTAIALAVAAIPEGLPAVVTVTLALGMHRMAKRHAIVKQLAAVETLGCTSVICSDKTGTLTVNQMTARTIYYRDRKYRVEGEGYDMEGDIHVADTTELPDLAKPADLNPLLLPLTLCNDAHLRGGKVIGDPMEGALIVLAAKAGISYEITRDRYPRIAEIPFDAAHKYMASFHLDGDLVRVYIKGAPEVLIDLCTQIQAADGYRALESLQRTALLTVNESMAGEGLRVLAFASITLPVNEFDASQDLFCYLKDLRLEGLAGLMDPPRSEAYDAIALCHQAGIAVKMITGDQKVTAAAIAKELGLKGDVLSSTELDALSDAALAERIDQISVFARATPEQKVRIVKALKSHGHITAMTGDGVNDAPALKSADIGIAMGRSGSDVTREAAAMVLTDDNFVSIVQAVEEGRTIYDNIIKFVRFQLSTNIGAILTVFTAPLLGLPLPFSPIQILWINIIMDGPPAMALGVDPPRPELMNEPPRETEGRILTFRRLGNLAAYGATMAVGTLGVLYWGITTGPIDHALTMAFTTFVLFQIFNVFNARTDRNSAFNITFFQNRPLWLALASVVGLQLLVVHWSPVQSIFHTTDLSRMDWGICIVTASSVLILEELRKAGQRLIGLFTG